MAFNDWFRRNQKKVYIVMIFAMVAWGIGSSAMFLIPQKPIGTVLGENISRDEFADFESRWRKVILAGYNRPTLDIIWKQMIYERAASQTGIVVTDNDIIEGVHDIAGQILKTTGDVPTEQLIMILCNSFGVNRSQLMQTIKEVVTIHKLDYFLKDSVKITEDEAWQRYSAANKKVKLKYVEFNAKDFVDSVEATDTEITDFYNKHKDIFPDKLTGSYGYKENEKVKIEYIMASYSELEKQINVPDDELSKYYDDNKADFVKPVAEVTEDVDSEKKTDVDDSIKYKPFDEVKVEIKNKLVKEKSKELAKSLISKVDEFIYDNIDKLNRPTFEELAQRFSLIYNIPKHGKRNSEFITKEDSETLLVGTDRLANIAFEREKFDPSPPMNALEGMYIFQVIEKQFPMSPPLEVIRETVENDVKTEKAFRKSRELADQCLSKIKTLSFDDGVKSFKTEAGLSSMDIDETEYLIRSVQTANRPSGYIVAMQGYRPDVLAKAFKLKDNAADVAVEDEGKKACYVIAISDKKEADRKEFDENKDKLVENYTIQKQKYILKKWEEDLTRKSHLNIEL